MGECRAAGGWFWAPGKAKPSIEKRCLKFSLKSSEKVFRAGRSGVNFYSPQKVSMVGLGTKGFQLKHLLLLFSQSYNCFVLGTTQVVHPSWLLCDNFSFFLKIKNPSTAPMDAGRSTSSALQSIENFNVKVVQNHPSM